MGRLKFLNHLWMDGTGKLKCLKKKVTKVLQLGEKLSFDVCGAVDVKVYIEIHLNKMEAKLLILCSSQVQLGTER